MLSAGIIVAICVMLLLQALPFLRQYGGDIGGIEWHPHSLQFGMLPLFYGTACVAFIAIILAAPIGLFSAMFLSECLPKRYRVYLKTALEWLAGIPSIIYGLLGVALLGPWLMKQLDADFSRTILTAGLLLAVMILPTIITLIDDAFHHIPQSYRDTALTLGLYPHEVVFKVIIPLTKTDIVGAILLALGRALGETMAVMLIIGGIDKIPIPWFNLLQPGQTMTSKLGREIPEAVFGSLHFSALMAMALLLFSLVLLLTWISHIWFNPEQRRYE